jgi:hypothetical protein
MTDQDTSAQEATGEAAVCATCHGSGWKPIKEVPARYPSTKVPCPDCTPRTETQGSAVEEARKALWAAYYDIQLAVQHPDRFPPPNMLEKVEALEAAITREANERWRLEIQAGLLSIRDWQARAEAAERERDEALGVVEYAINLDAIWHQPHADTAAGLAAHHASLDKGFTLLREAIAALTPPTPPAERIES